MPETQTHQGRILAALALLRDMKTEDSRLEHYLEEAVSCLEAAADWFEQPAD